MGNQKVYQFLEARRLGGPALGSVYPLFFFFLVLLISIVSRVSYVQYKMMVELEKKLIHQRQFTKLFPAPRLTGTQAPGEHNETF